MNKFFLITAAFALPFVGACAEKAPKQEPTKDAMATISPQEEEASWNTFAKGEKKGYCYRTDSGITCDLGKGLREWKKQQEAKRH